MTLANGCLEAYKRELDPWWLHRKRGEGVQWREEEVAAKREPKNLAVKEESIAGEGMCVG